MLTAPLIRANVYAKVEAEERADYLRGEIQETGDDGRPYMAIRTTRDEGDDLVVHPGVAYGSGNADTGRKPAPLHAAAMAGRR